MNTLTGCVEITAQNHGFGPIYPSLGNLLPEFSKYLSKSSQDAEAAEPSEVSLKTDFSQQSDLRFWTTRKITPIVQNEKFGKIALTHVNLNDGTCEGVAFLDIPAFSVQYHPEAAPGPTDSHYLFTAFTRLMEGRSDYLDINISNDRLCGWNFSDTTLAQGE